jgi:hypothetical protein
MSPVIRVKPEAFIPPGQHYSYNMDECSSSNCDYLRPSITWT